MNAATFVKLISLSTTTKEDPIQWLLTMLQFSGEWTKDERTSTKLSSLSMDNVPEYVSSYFTKWSANIAEFVSTNDIQIYASDINSFAPIRVQVGTKNACQKVSYSRNSTGFLSSTDTSPPTTIITMMYRLPVLQH
jgi:hypothetical protein